MRARRGTLVVGTAVFGALVLTAAVPGPVDAKVFLSIAEALALAFPDCDVERGTVFLTDAQRASASELAGIDIGTSLVHPYAARCSGVPRGTAYFDSHRVRTLPETVMVVVDPEGRVARVEVLSFQEPEDYLPRRNWYDQFHGRPLDSELALKKGIRGVTGATLTARATAEAVRRMLAIHRVLAREDRDAATAAGTGGRPADAATASGEEAAR